MKNKLIKIIGCLSLTIMIITTIIPVFAITPSSINIETMNSYNSTKSLRTVSGNILGAVQIIGTAISVILFISSIIGYFCVVPEKRNKKKTIICIVCAIILFFCSNVLGLRQGPCCIWIE